MRPARTLIILGLVAALLALALGLAACGEDEEATDEGKVYKIGVTQIVSHPALDSCVEGFKEAMAERGFVEGENVEYDLQNAQGDMPTASSIAQKFAGEELDLILSVATPTSQAVVKEETETPIVFAAVTDPVGAGLVADAAAPDANVTGVSDLLPIQPHLDLVRRVVPDIKTIGLLYNAGETNSVVLVEAEKEAAEVMGIEVVEATADKSSEVQAAAKSLVGRVDAISVLTDNTVVSALEAVVKVCRENGIPLIAGDTDSVKRGAITALAFDYKDHGRQAGMMAADILEGKAIGEIPVAYAENLVLSVNPDAAKAMGVTLPQDLLDEADETF